MYTYNDDYLFDNKIGEDGISKKSLSATKKKIQTIFNNTFSHTSSTTKYYKVIHPKNVDELVNHLEPTAKHIREQFDNVVIVSMGGATLGPQTIAKLRQKKNSKPRIKFLNTTDPMHFENTISPMKLDKTAVLVISNSGKTIETISMAGAIIEKMHKAGIKNIGKHFFFIVGAGNNNIRKIAQELNSLIIDHDPNVGGRFTGFTSVGILSGLIAGLNMREFISGLNTTAQDFWLNKEESVPCHAAASLYNLNKPIWPYLAYLEGFSPFLEWYAQIVAESLAKEGKGYTPVRGTGPMDQHSMLQLYLQGPRDKMYTMIYVNNTNHHKSKIFPGAHPEFLQLKTLDEINSSMFQATLSSLQDNKLPVRTIMLNEFDEFNMGCLWMHASIEIITIGHLMGINPFDQPGVEQIKVHAEKLIRA